MSRPKIQEGRLEYRQFIVLDDGTEHRVRYNQDPELYKGTDVPLFKYTAKEGRGENAKTVTRFAVPFEQALRARRASVSDSVNAMLAQGLTAEQIVQKLASK